MLIVLWTVAVITICRSNDINRDKKLRLLAIAIPAILSVTGEAAYDILLCKFYTIKNALTYWVPPYDPP